MLSIALRSSAFSLTLVIPTEDPALAGLTNKGYVSTYSSMKPQQAADIFNTMTDNLDLVADILEAMDTESRANILGKMDKDIAAKITQILKP